MSFFGLHMKVFPGSQNQLCSTRRINYVVTFLNDKDAEPVYCSGESCRMEKATDSPSQAVAHKSYSPISCLLLTHTIYHSQYNVHSNGRIKVHLFQLELRGLVLWSLQVHTPLMAGYNLECPEFAMSELCIVYH